MEKLIFQDIVESRLEKRTKGVYVPVGGKILIAFMDDFNMPMKEIYGSQPPLELIRQWIGYGFWCVSNPSANYFIVVEVSSLKLIKKKKKKRYDREKQTQMFIQKLQLLVSMGPPGGGRNVITNRLLTKFNVINMTFPAEKQIVRIYGSMLHHHISEFHSEVKGIGREAS